MEEILFLSLLAGLATTLGALVILAIDRLSEKTLILFLGLAAGIMLSVVLLDLLPSALSYGSFLTSVLGFGAGLIFLIILSGLLASLESFSNFSGGGKWRRMGYLIALGIALHDLPEGIAIAAGFTATTQLGWLLAVAIGLHNIPEGMAMATPLALSGLSPNGILGLAALVSLVTPLGTLLGLFILGLNRSLLSFLLALAAGAMVYVVFWEILPQCRKPHPRYGLAGIILGFLVIVILSLLE